MDFLDSIKRYIEANVDLFVNYLQVGLLADGDSIAIRPTPSTPPTRYLEGSKIQKYQFQILVAHSNIKTAHDTCQEIESKIDGLTNGAVLSSNGSFIFNKCEVYSTTDFVEKRTGGETVWTALFQAELEI